MTSGNSLFGEVDDRRMNVERKMISLKVKYESLERTHATANQQLRKLKVRKKACVRFKFATFIPLQCRQRCRPCFVSTVLLQQMPLKFRGFSEHLARAKVSFS